MFLGIVYYFTRNRKSNLKPLKFQNLNKNIVKSGFDNMFLLSIILLVTVNY